MNRTTALSAIAALALSVGALSACTPAAQSQAGSAATAAGNAAGAAATAAGTAAAAGATAVGQAAATASADAELTRASVALHNTADNCWTIIDGNVYDLTAWVSQHPGGKGAITGLCGKDGSAAFKDQHGNNSGVAKRLDTFKKGALKG